MPFLPFFFLLANAMHWLLFGYAFELLVLIHVGSHNFIMNACTRTGRVKCLRKSERKKRLFTIFAQV